MTINWIRHAQQQCEQKEDGNLETCHHCAQGSQSGVIVTSQETQSDAHVLAFVVYYNS